MTDHPLRYVFMFKTQELNSRAKCSAHVILTALLRNKYDYHPHLSDKITEVQRLSHLFSVSQLINGSPGVCMRIFLSISYRRQQQCGQVRSR